MFLTTTPLYRLSILIMLIVAFLNLTSCLDHLPWNQEKDFENDMVKALNLKFISRDNDYEYSPLRVFNDTLVGKYSHFDNHQMEYHYFIQSLKNPNYKVVFNNEDLDVPLISPIDYYRNGCIYFGKYQGVFMQKICIDGSLTNYFNNSTDTDQIKPSYESKVMIYKNQAVLSLINGLFVFDIPSQKLIWKWHRGDNALPLSTIIGNKLILSLAYNGSMDVTCYDLDKDELLWIKKIKGKDSNASALSEYVPSHPLFHDNSNVIIPGRINCYLIDVNSGIVTDTIKWKKFFKNDMVGNFKIENNRLYTTNLNDDKVGLLCLDIKTKKIIWNLKGVFLSDFYKNEVIGYTLGKTHKYFIIDKNTGAVKNTITDPDDGRQNFIVVDNYVLINNNTIYQ